MQGDVALTFIAHLHVLPREVANLGQKLFSINVEADYNS
mgnify:CR=1 FL=1